jgi:hypothetical protein
MSIDMSGYDRFTVSVEAEKLTIEYADCGSHRVLVEIVAERQHLRGLLNQLEPLFK